RVEAAARNPPAICTSREPSTLAVVETDWPPAPRTNGRIESPTAHSLSRPRAPAGENRDPYVAPSAPRRPSPPFDRHARLRTNRVAIPGARVRPARDPGRSHRGRMEGGRRADRGPSRHPAPERLPPVPARSDPGAVW